MRKNPYGKILRGKLRKQHISIVPKFSSELIEVGSMIMRKKVTLHC